MAMDIALHWKQRSPIGSTATVRRASELLAEAGIRINGHNPWDLKIHHIDMLERTLAVGSLGLGESYMEGWWDCDRLDEFFYRVLSAGLDARVGQPGFWWTTLRQRVFNLQSPTRAWMVGRQHYDLDHGLYAAMLDPNMAYSCGYWAYARTLEDAQEAKLELICRKLGLQKGMRLLDIGCGWGSLMRYAAQRYGVHCVGLTVSKEQAAWGTERCAGLPVRFELVDYRNFQPSGGQPFDRVASVGMFEHVGLKNLRAYFDIVHRLLKPGGIALNHGITSSDVESRSVGMGAGEFIDRYVFPQGELPHLVTIGKAVSEVGLEIVDVESLRLHYARTLQLWSQGLERQLQKAAQWVPEKSLRIWRLYLAGCAYGFQHGWMNLHQILAVKPRDDGGHDLPWTRADLYS